MSVEDTVVRIQRSLLVIPPPPLSVLGLMVLSFLLRSNIGRCGFCLCHLTSVCLCCNVNLAFHQSESLCVSSHTLLHSPAYKWV